MNPLPPGTPRLQPWPSPSPKTLGASAPEVCLFPPQSPVKPKSHPNTTKHTTYTLQKSCIPSIKLRAAQKIAKRPSTSLGLTYNPPPHTNTASRPEQRIALPSVAQWRDP